VTSDLARHLGVVTRDLVGARAMGERAVAIARSIGDLGLEANASFRLGDVYQGLGQFPAAIEILTRNVALIPDDRLHETFGGVAPSGISSRALLAGCLAELGRFPEAARWASEAVRIGEAVDHPVTLAQAYQTTGYMWLLRGDPDRA